MAPPPPANHQPDQPNGKAITVQQSNSHFPLLKNSLPLPNVNDAAYTRNRRLISNGEKMHSTMLSCPKSLALDRTKQQLYTGTLSGKVYCCSLVQSDDSSSSSSQTAAPAPEPQVLHSFDGGRPLGMRLSSDGTVLYFIEANSGLYAYDLQRKECRHLLGRCSLILISKPLHGYQPLLSLPLIALFAHLLCLLCLAFHRPGRHSLPRWPTFEVL